MKTTRLSLAAAVVASLSLGTSAMAQTNTGVDTFDAGTRDNQWSFSYSGALGSDANDAYVINPTPGAWPAPSSSFWIGVTTSGSLPGGSGDNVQRVSYDFTTSFAGGGSSLAMTVWTDNFLTGYTFNGVLHTIDPLAPPPGDFAQPMPRTFTLLPTGGTNDLTLHFTGDGLTDGVNVAFTATPEPASVALLATGLLGLGGVVARRRRSLQG